MVVIASRVVDLWSHGPDFSGDTLVLNPDVFLGWRAGDYVEISPVSPEGSGEAAEPAGLLLPGAVLVQLSSMGPVRGSLAASLRSAVADAVGFPTRQATLVRRLPSAAAAAASYGLSHVELSFKDQYASRSGLWRFRRRIQGSVFYAGQHVSACGLRVQVRGEFFVRTHLLACAWEWFVCKRA